MSEETERGRTQAILENLVSMLTNVGVKVDNIAQEQQSVAIKLATTEANVALQIARLRADVDMKVAKVQADWSGTHAAQDKRICELEDAKRMLQWVVAVTITALIAFASTVAWGLLTHQLHIGP